MFLTIQHMQYQKVFIKATFSCTKQFKFMECVQCKQHQNHTIAIAMKAINLIKHFCTHSMLSTETKKYSLLLSQCGSTK